jgi:hypothetical protein
MDTLRRLDSCTEHPSEVLELLVIVFWERVTVRIECVRIDP